MEKNNEIYDSMYKSIDRFTRYSPETVRAIDEYFVECNYLEEIANDGIKILVKTYDWSLNKYLSTVYNDLILYTKNNDEKDKDEYRYVVTRGLLEILIVKIVDMENTHDDTPEDVVEYIKDSIIKLANNLDMSIHTKDISFEYIMEFKRYTIDNISNVSNIDLSDDFLCLGWFSRNSNTMCIYSGDLC